MNILELDNHEFMYPLTRNGTWPADWPDAPKILCTQCKQAIKTTNKDIFANLFWLL